MMNDLQLLSDLIEGLLSPESKAELQERLELEPELRAQFSELKSLFDERADLAVYPVPPGLCDATLAILEIEGLVPKLDSVLVEELPDGLIAATMSRLEDEGLVQSSAAKPSSPLYSVALTLIVLLLAFAGGWILRPMFSLSATNQDSSSTPVPASPEKSELESLRLQVKLLEDQLLEFQKEENDKTLRENTEIIALRQSNAGLSTRLAEEKRRSEKLATRELKLKKRLDNLDAVGKKNNAAFIAVQTQTKRIERSHKDVLAKLAAKELRLRLILEREEENLRKLALLNSALNRERTNNERTRESLLVARNRLSAVAKKSAVFMIVKDAQHLDYWDGAWKSVVNGVKLAPGTLLRAESSRTMLRFEQRSLRLVAGYFQVTGSDKLIAVPLTSSAPEDEIVASRRSPQSSPAGNRDERLDPLQGIFNRLRN
ncbi:MAG: hypothetical protein P1V97_38850 [Planctomycetota bacterium]|nr:hypothetical protein [Planctomycetota bacterium]